LPPELCGVRALDGNRLHLAEAGSLDLQPGDLVIVEGSAGQWVGRVAVSPGQLVAVQGAPEPTGRVLRKAREDEARAGQQEPDSDEQIPREWSAGMEKARGAPVVQNEWEVQRFANGYVAGRFGEDAVPGGDLRSNP